MASYDRTHTVLLVDDEAGIRNVLKITLSHAGFQVLLAPDGDAGLALFRETRPDIVVTDIKMPGMDGIELLRRVKQIRPETEVIMITGHGDMELAVKSLQHEAADFISKPIDSRELELSMARAVDRISINARIRSHMEDLEKLIREKDRKLDESENLITIGQTVAGMSHVIKTIAGGLKSSSFILEQGIETENREYLVKGWQMMKGNVDKISNLSLDLLNYAKTSRLNIHDMDPNQPAREVAALLAHRAEQEKIDFSLDLVEGTMGIPADKDALTNALFNLVTNAMDACSGKDRQSLGQVRLLVRKKTGMLVYQVRDNGTGMDEGICDILFKEFITTKGSRGTGFGLMTTRKIVKEHQGRISFETKRGQGSCFTIELPVARA